MDAKLAVKQRTLVEKKLHGHIFSICGAVDASPMVPLTMEDLKLREKARLATHYEGARLQPEDFVDRALTIVRQRLTIVTAANLGHIVMGVRLRRLYGRFMVVDVDPHQRVDPPYLIETAGYEPLRRALRNFNAMRRRHYTKGINTQVAWYADCIIQASLTIPHLLTLEPPPTFQELEFFTDEIGTLCAAGYTTDGYEHRWRPAHSNMYGDR